MQHNNLDLPIEGDPLLSPVRDHWAVLGQPIKANNMVIVVQGNNSELIAECVST
jgi:hypothetical protein